MSASVPFTIEHIRAKRRAKFDRQNKDNIRPGALSREKSTVVTNQEQQTTCFAHSSSTMLSRFIKNKYGRDFEIENENCHYYYNTVKCSVENTIFDCFLNMKKMPVDGCDKNIDQHGWNKENISAILFIFLYNLLIDALGCEGASVHDCVSFFVYYFKNHDINEETIKMILRYNENSGHWLWRKYSRSDKLYFQDLITKLHNLLKTISKHLNDGTISLSLYSGSQDRTFRYGMEHLDTQYLFRTVQFDNSLYYPNFWEKFTQVLDHGYYGALSHDSHCVTITGHEDDKLIVKNSWGPGQTSWGDVILDNKVLMKNVYDKDMTVCFIYDDNIRRGGRRIKRTKRRRPKRLRFTKARK